METSAKLAVARVSYAGWTPYAAIGGLGALMWWLSAQYPAAMPPWMPWEFSPLQYLAVALALFWFLRGLVRSRAAERLPVWRQVLFVVGLGLIYAVLQTRFEYFAQHMFFINRIQHVAMHHFGPFLIALSWPGPALWRGMPEPLRRLVESRPVGATMAVVQHPALAPILFVGLFALWLVPPIHFHAMLDARLYALMNWSMVVDGILFWVLVFDPRPKPPARASYGVRAALAIGVMFPQIVLGAIISFAGVDIYPYYALCGRIFPTITAVADQQFGGVIIWIPPAMMSVAGMLLVLNFLRIHEQNHEETDANAAAMAALSARWTGN